jgi:hypothetical protein
VLLRNIRSSPFFVSLSFVSVSIAGFSRSPCILLHRIDCFGFALTVDPVVHFRLDIVSFSFCLFAFVLAFSSVNLPHRLT